MIPIGRLRDLQVRERERGRGKEGRLREGRGTVDQWLESLGGDYEVDDQGPDVLEVKERELAEAKLKNLELQTRLSEAQDKVFKEQSEKEVLANEKLQQKKWDLLTLCGS